MKIALDIPAWRLLPACERTWGIPTSEAPETVKFALVGQTAIISANVVDDGAKIELYPDRSSQHAALKAALLG